MLLRSCGRKRRLGLRRDDAASRRTKARQQRRRNMDLRYDYELDDEAWQASIEGDAEPITVPQSAVQEAQADEGYRASQLAAGAPSSK